MKRQGQDEYKKRGLAPAFDWYANESWHAYYELTKKDLWTDAPPTQATIDRMALTRGKYRKRMASSA